MADRTTPDPAKGERPLVTQVFQRIQQAGPLLHAHHKAALWSLLGHKHFDFSTFSGPVTVQSLATGAGIGLYSMRIAIWELERAKILEVTRPAGRVPDIALRASRLFTLKEAVALDDALRGRHRMSGEEEEGSRSGRGDRSGSPSRSGRGDRSGRGRAPAAGGVGSRSGRGEGSRSGRGTPPASIIPEIRIQDPIQNSLSEGHQEREKGGDSLQAAHTPNTPPPAARPAPRSSASVERIAELWNALAPRVGVAPIEAHEVPAVFCGPPETWWIADMTTHLDRDDPEGWQVYRAAIERVIAQARAERASPPTVSPPPVPTSPPPPAEKTTQATVDDVVAAWNGAPGRPVTVGAIAESTVIPPVLTQVPLSLVTRAMGTYFERTRVSAGGWIGTAPSWPAFARHAEAILGWVAEPSTQEPSMGRRDAGRATGGAGEAKRQKSRGLIGEGQGYSPDDDTPVPADDAERARIEAEVAAARELVRRGGRHAQGHPHRSVGVPAARPAGGEVAGAAGLHPPGAGGVGA